jgi:hypothetical protein
MGLIGAGRAILKPEPGSPQGFGMPVGPRLRPSHVVAQNRLPVQVLEGTSPGG